MPCCEGHTCDYCATCKLGVCCNEGRGAPSGDPFADPIREPGRRTAPAEAPTMPIRTPAGMEAHR